ncbi:OmpP1/FadL family transporter [Acinetobacter terrestris]|uniref:OmpP1/FadL family transporter n=1 Tax=Acinetobacter terrestris TaxID=2529843 RepID=UPI00103E850D|nr:outer membrane protein transport protein [Acinetobacter terrestris]TCB62527.1 transporter [Acinetobacter terrestris]
MKLTVIHSAILLSLIPTTATFAGGLDRSGQSISAFLQPGNYAEAGISVLDPTVKGSSTVQGFEGEKISDMAEDYYFPSAAIKVQATDKISLGLIYDQPFGADSQYAATAGSFGNGTEGTSVEVKTNNLTALIGYQPTENWNFYAGPVWQTVEADIKLRGAAYAKPPAGTLSGYNINVEQEEAYGWLAGFAYQIPEIALKAAVTYRSEIKHNAKSKETYNLIPGFAYIDELEAITPQSVNLDLQTGISQNTLAFANLRWVHWDQFAVTPSFLAQTTAALGAKQNLIDYSDDQYSITTGLSHKFNSKWAGTAAIGWDSGAGNPVTTLGPTEGYWNVGLGGQYSPAENYFIQAGVKYFWLGDAQAQTGGSVKADFTDNHAIGYGMKIGYRF